MKANLSIGQLATLACILEVTARKPGNVHPGARFSDMGYFDFVASALAIGTAMDRAIEAGVGATVLAAVRSTGEVVSVNTNLGAILLLAPLAAAAPDQPLRVGVTDVLRGLSVSDTRAVFAAIRHANPGGLGRVADHDVTDDPTFDLRRVMMLAAERDSVARQYVNGFHEVLEEAVPAIVAAQQAGLDWEQTIVRCHLELMARHPDSLIARKLGWDTARESAGRAAEVLAAGWPATDAAQRLCCRFDEWLRADGNQRNPGTTADLVTAGLFAALREARMKLES